MPAVETEPRQATQEDIDAIAATLTMAFYDDPVMRWALPDDVTRHRRLSGMWRVLAGGYVPRGGSSIVSDHDAVALWMPPGHHLGEEFWRANGATFYEAVDGEMDRLVHLGEVMGEHHPVGREYWYLFAVGVDPSAQSRGLGSVLLAHTLVKADEHGDPAYLEATSSRSRALYERFGFEVTDELRAADSPPLWAMWREPSS